ncbi:DUF3039 domain-containing protein [Actinotalea sp. Marseille-Q4924]|uniref:DUF3039 domain-containing protein n=1 Tax=Actinotalea sp. Marseille-Q4924 TaxID=2866571 RepID=UPI001CE4375E|nr:DUF3039 domain-containing protein [Actinotalea sp. Marseille-Q4924]
MSQTTGPEDPYGAPGDGTSTSVLERTEAREELEPGDRERFSHYVRKEKILASAVSGTPVVALCGKVWVPGRDPQKFPVCPVCKEIYDGLRDPQDGGPGDSGGPGSGGSGAGFGSGGR